jgi:hypothetical protein
MACSLPEVDRGLTPRSVHLHFDALKAFDSFLLCSGPLYETRAFIISVNGRQFQMFNSGIVIHVQMFGVFAE